MAWVRPKHPPPKKPKPDPVSTLLPMLSYFSSSRPPPPISPTKPKPHQISSTPLSRDPILRSFQQTQAISEAEPEPSYEETRPKPSHPRRDAPSRSPHEREHHVLASQRAQTAKGGFIRAPSTRADSSRAICSPTGELSELPGEDGLESSISE
ncbi:MAG: hypothetical protein Q9192_008269, partial [Flavoplaca navasiana]